jgi:hypothetical protein
VSNNSATDYSTPSASDRLIIKFLGLRRNDLTPRSNIGRFQRQKRKSLNEKLLKLFHTKPKELVAKHLQTVAKRQK